VLLNANGADVYAWSPAAGLSCSNCASPIASPAITTTYIVTGTSTFGCIGYDTITVTVHPTPSVNAGPDTAVCLGNSVNLAGTGAATYTWSPATGLSCTNCANPTASPSVATTYVVTGISAYGCIGYDSVTVNIHSLPLVNAGPDTAICQGGSVALGASGAVSYSWSPASGLSCTNCANPVASPAATTTYIVTGTSAYGCIGQDTVIVTVHPLPVVNAGLDTAICIGGTVNLSASGAASYVWSPATGLSCTNCANPTASPTATTSYIVTGTSAYGCIGNDTIKVTVHPLPTVNAGPDTAVCLGGSVNLSASGAATYVWSPAAGLSCTSCANPIASPTTTTTYIVTGTSTYGCINQDTITVTVHALPVVNAGNDTAICKGNSATLNASGTASYTWSPATGLSCTNCANPTASPTTTTTYVVTGTSAYGCTGHNTVTVTVHPLPVVNAGLDTAVCIGGSVNLSASGATSYSWSPAVGLSCTSCANPTASPTVTTNYIVTGTSAYGCTGNDTIKVTVHPLPTVNAGPDTAVCPGGNVNLSASGANTYSWSPAAGLSCTNCANPIASPTTTTSYIVNGTSAYGCVNQDTVTVSVHALPVVHAGNDTVICKGYSATLNATGANTYTWSPVTGLSCTNCASPVASPTVTTSYIVTGTSAQGCIGHDTITVTVNTVSIHAGNDTALCFGDSVTLNAAGGIVYSWSPAVGLSCSNCANPVASPSTTTTYILTGTNESGCTANDTVVVTIHPLPIVNAGADTGLCQGTSVHLLATGATTYNWLPATGLSCSNCANPTAAPTTTTTYIVTGTSAYGCVSRDTVNVAVHPIPLVNAGTDTAICIGNSVVLQSGGSYTWSPVTGLSCSICANPVASPTMSTTYIASSNSAYGCVGRDTVIVTVRPLPVVTTNNDTTICAGGTVTLTATGTDNYVWTPVAGLSCADCASPTTSPTDDVSYKVTGSDIYGCAASDSLVIKTIKKHATTGGGNDTICTGQDVQLNASGGDSYLWVPGDGLSNNTSANPTASPAGNTDYNVYVYQGGCFVDTYAVHILVYPTPTVTLGPDQSVVTGSTITLNAVATNTLKYEWYPIATECNNCSSVNIIANQSGRYTVVVTGEKGCQDSASVMIKVHCDKSEIFIPNTFTPNNDGNNDLFYASGKGISLIKVFNVYDRWGELLYSVHNVPPNEVKYGWDGTYKGEKLKPDVYVYYIIATCESGEAMEYKGDISLIR
jgi:gliding motility-associated-like protein